MLQRSPRGGRLTSQWAEEVEEGLGGHLLADGSDRAPALMLLLLPDGFHRHILPFLPVNSAPGRAQPL